MINTKDIKDRIESDFGDNASEVFKILHDANSKTDYLNHNLFVVFYFWLARA